MKQTGQNLQSRFLYSIISAPDKEYVKCFKIKYLLFNDILFNLQNIITFIGYSKKTKQQNSVVKILFLK